MGNQQVKFDPARLQEYGLSAEVGNASTPEGLTRVVLDGTGRIVVEVELAELSSGLPEEEVKRRPGAITGRMAPERVAVVLRQASQFAWDRKFPSRPGIPDEPVVVWRYRVGGEEVMAMRAWLRDVEKDPAMAPVLAALREGAAELSGGQVYL